MNGSRLIKLAKQFAADAHKGQVRKLNAEPFMNHPENVARLLYDAGFREELVAAGYLHDVVEDTDVSLAEIESVFGKEVSRLVAGNTESTGLPWIERKLETIGRAEKGSLECKALICADKLDNLSNIMKYFQLSGDEVWKAFSVGKDQQYWYYSEVAKALFANIGGMQVPDYFSEYGRLVRKLKEVIQ